MNVFLIQPATDANDAPLLESTARRFQLFAPPWSLLCLEAFLAKHTRHISRFIDARLLSDLETDLLQQLDELAAPRVVVINCPLLALGQVAAILEIIKRHQPHTRTVLCGAFPSKFPQQAIDLPRVDYALAGDPEPILRNLLDYLDVPPRLRRTPGLIMRDTSSYEPHWIPRLATLALPEWDQVFWQEYADNAVNGICRAEMQISRGHSGVPADRAFGGTASPLRRWPLDRLANLLSRSAHTEIQEVVLTDAPGFWDDATLREWTRQLLMVRNVQPWALRRYAGPIDADLISDLYEAHCNRIDFVFPSCDPAVLERFGLELDISAISDTMTALNDHGILAIPCFWIGGPEEQSDEGLRIGAMLRRLNQLTYRIEPFPFAVDSPLYAEYQQRAGQPALEDWIHWARDPWNSERPLALWGGNESEAVLVAEVQKAQRLLKRSPGMLRARLREALRSKSIITSLEDRAIAFLRRRGNPNLPI